MTATATRASVDGKTTFNLYKLALTLQESKELFGSHVTLAAAIIGSVIANSVAHCSKKRLVCEGLSEHQAKNLVCVVFHVDKFV